MSYLELYKNPLKSGWCIIRYIYKTYNIHLQFIFGERWRYWIMFLMPFLSNYEDSSMNQYILFISGDYNKTGINFIRQTKIRLSLLLISPTNNYITKNKECFVFRLLKWYQTSRHTTLHFDNDYSINFL